MRTKQSRTNQEARAAGKARRVRSGALGKLLIMLAIVAAVVFGVAIFFKVSTIEVQGNTVYSSEQIVEASQIQPGDNLLTVNKALAVGNIKAALPYVEDVSIARSLPDGTAVEQQQRQHEIDIGSVTDHGLDPVNQIQHGDEIAQSCTKQARNHQPHVDQRVSLPVAAHTHRHDHTAADGADVIPPIVGQQQNGTSADCRNHCNRPNRAALLHKDRKNTAADRRQRKGKHSGENASFRQPRKEHRNGEYRRRQTI